jgi:hypothetical protein
MPRESLSVAPSEGAIMAAPYGAKAPGLDVSEGARSFLTAMRTD